jgi:hypothetical protein
VSEWAANAMVFMARYIADPLGQLGAFVAIVAIVAVFWHFSLWAGVALLGAAVFLVLCIPGGIFIQWIKYVRQQLKRQSTEATAQSPDQSDSDN